MQTGWIRKSRWVLGAGACLAAILLFAQAQAARSAASQPVANAACRHIIGKYDPHEPCIVGNVQIYCFYNPGGCEGVCGSEFRGCAWQKYLNCRVSEELGEMSYVDNNPEKGYIYKHPHKRVTCKGSATILKVYTQTGPHTPYSYQEVTAHSAHSLAITIQGRYAGPDSATIGGAKLVVMAQR